MSNINFLNIIHNYFFARQILCACVCVVIQTLTACILLPASCISRKYILVLSTSQEDGHPPSYCVALQSTTSSCVAETRPFVRKVSKTSERIDIEKLKAREQIMFFDDVLLFEDELHDHGVSMISVKIVSPARVSTEQCHSSNMV